MIWRKFVYSGSLCSHARASTGARSELRRAQAVPASERSSEGACFREAQENGDVVDAELGLAQVVLREVFAQLIEETLVARAFFGEMTAQRSRARASCSSR